MNHKLYIARREKNLKQKEVADLLHINSTTYYRKENGISEFTLSEAFTLSALFETSVDKLFGNGEAEEEDAERAPDFPVSQETQKAILDYLLRVTLPAIVEVTRNKAR